MNRECDGCTKCCEGWLAGKINNYEISVGVSCPYMVCSGCSIQDSKPEYPCKVYNCGWLKDNSIPLEFKPNISNIIITIGKAEEHEYVMLTQAGETYNKLIIDYFINEFNSGKIKNLIINVDNETISYTTPISKVY